MYKDRVIAAFDKMVINLNYNMSINVGEKRSCLCTIRKVLQNCVQFFLSKETTICKICYHLQNTYVYMYVVDIWNIYIHLFAHAQNSSGRNIGTI